MKKYTDDDIRNMRKVSCIVAADYLGLNPMAVRIGLRNERLPIGFAVKTGTTSYGSETWRYEIIPERLIAYKNGTLNETDVQSIVRSLEIIIEQFENFKRDIIPYLKGSQK